MIISKEAEGKNKIQHRHKEQSVQTEPKPLVLKKPLIWLKIKAYCSSILTTLFKTSDDLYSFKWDFSVLVQQ